MFISEQRVDSLAVRVYSDRRTLGAAAASACVQAVVQAVERQGRARVIWASAASQNEFLEAVAADPTMPWERVTAFHMDEYVGITSAHPGSFRRYLYERLPLRRAAFHELRGDVEDLGAECRRYASLLGEDAVDVCCLGIGENGHLAFNEPSVADFQDPIRVKLVSLDPASRHQQVHDGLFADVSAVPERALTLTVPALLAARQLICVVPGIAKAAAVQQALQGAIVPQCPASVLRTHAAATLYLDNAAAGSLSLAGDPR